MRYAIVILCLLFAVVGCSRDYHRDSFVKIDCTKKTLTTVRVPQGNQAVRLVHLHIEGEVDGKGVLEWEGGNKTREVSGKVDLDWSGDWYQPQCRIIFSPTGAASGTLRIYYRFETV